MTHHGDDGGAGLRRTRELFALLALVLQDLFGRCNHRFDAEIVADLFGELVGEGLVGGHHHALLDQQPQQFLGGDVELLRQLPRGDHLRQDDRPFGLLAILELNGARGTGRRRPTVVTLLAATSLFAGPTTGWSG